MQKAGASSEHLQPLLPLARKPVLGRRAWTQMWALVTSGMLEVPMHTSAFQGTQESLNRQLPAVVPQTTCCELIPQHLPATSFGTPSSYRVDARRATRCNRCLQGKGKHMKLSRDSIETGYSVAFASRLVSPLGVLLCQHSGKRGRCSDFSPMFSPLQQVFTGTCRVELAVSSSGDPKLRH